MPLEQAVLDHRVIERFTDGENPRMRVLVVGARRDSIERLLGGHPQGRPRCRKWWTSPPSR